MSSPLHSLSRAQLSSLAEALANGRLVPPLTVVAVQRHVPGPEGDLVASELQRLNATGMQPAQLGYLITAIVTEREAAQRGTDRVELVWTGPENVASSSRDTGVVVRELFSAARKSVYVAGFAVHNGRTVFKPLAENMEANPHLAVRMFLNIGRQYMDHRPAADLVQRFANEFANAEWPGSRLPVMYHDPRALQTNAGPRASLHAKCIVADGKWSFITSANFTEAAQERNVEAGVLINDANFADALRSQLDGLVAAGVVNLIPQPSRTNAPSNT